MRDKGKWILYSAILLLSAVSAWGLIKQNDYPLLGSLLFTLPLFIVGPFLILLVSGHLIKSSEKHEFFPLALIIYFLGVYLEIIRYLSEYWPKAMALKEPVWTYLAINMYNMLPFIANVTFFAVVAEVGYYFIKFRTEERLEAVNAKLAAIESHGTALNMAVSDMECLSIVGPVIQAVKKLRDCVNADRLAEAAMRAFLQGYFREEERDLTIETGSGTALVVTNFSAMAQLFTSTIRELLNESTRGFEILSFWSLPPMNWFKPMKATTGWFGGLETYPMGKFSSEVWHGGYVEDMKALLMQPKIVFTRVLISFKDDISGLKENEYKKRGFCRHEDLQKMLSDWHILFRHKNTSFLYDYHDAEDFHNSIDKDWRDPLKPSTDFQLASSSEASIAGRCTTIFLPKSEVEDKPWQNRCKSVGDVLCKYAHATKTMCMNYQLAKRLYDNKLPRDCFVISNNKQVIFYLFSEVCLDTEIPVCIIHFGVGGTQAQVDPRLMNLVNAYYEQRDCIVGTLGAALVSNPLGDPPALPGRQQ